jgi:exonuclease SbcC
MEGFGAFRQRTEIDLDGVDLFALTGPTGSGKSSVIDAIIFALYGSIPRHGQGIVANVVTQGLLRARVRLDFSVGEASYTAVRVVRKDARTGRANTDEASLERGEGVLARNAKELSEQVEMLLGLSYDQFLKCVALPQGRFEQFLHARPADRGDLLVALLDAGIYQRVAQLAAGRQKMGEGRLAEIDAQLTQLTDMSAEVLIAVKNRIGLLERLMGEAEAAAIELSLLDDEAGRLSITIREASDHLAGIEAVRLPQGFADLATRLTAARDTVLSNEKELEAAESDLKEVERVVSELPQRSMLERLRQLHMSSRAEGEGLKELQRVLEERAGTAVKAASVLAAAEEKLASEQRQHAAQHLRVGLIEGEPCPVCLQPVEKVPAAGKKPSLRGAEATHKRALEEHRLASAEEMKARGRVDEKTRLLVGYREQLSGGPTLEETADLMGRHAAADAEALALRRRRDSAKGGLAAARRDAAALTDQEKTARHALSATRDRVSALKPPALDLQDLAADWSRLISWADGTRPVVEQRVATARGAELELGQRRAKTVASIVSWCEEAGVDIGRRPPRDAVADSLAAARARRVAVEEGLARVVELNEDRSRQAELVVVAKELAKHLKANNFEKWLLEESLRALAIGASSHLQDLAGGQYSLSLSSSLDFEIVDHHAADERRPVKSLSGGETFLVSLALALSLAEEVGSMSASGASRLEAIFLDEGFGSLDPESLDIVGSVIAEIGASGKMVGIVTHVKELADQVPVRFEISKTTAGASVRRGEE